jgi:hypothetical protein
MNAKLNERIEKEVSNLLLIIAPVIQIEIQKRMVGKWRCGRRQYYSTSRYRPETRQAISDRGLVTNFGDLMRHAREQANFTVALKIYELAVGRDAEYDNEGNLLQPSYPPNFDALKWWDRTRGEARKLLDLRTVRNQEQEANTVTLVIEGS